MAKIDAIDIPKLLMTEGAAPSTPASGKVYQYAKADGLMYSKDDAGVETLMSSGAGLANPMTTAGDIIYGGASGAPTRLASAGATTKWLRGANAAAPSWDLPPGYEYDYAELTSSVNVTATVEASADNIVSGNAVTYDGSTIVVVEFFSGGARPRNTTAAGNLLLWLFDGASSIGRLGFWQNVATGTDIHPVLVRRRLTPSAGAHTYHVKATVDAGTGNISAGAGGSGNPMPAFIRITKV